MLRHFVQKSFKVAQLNPKLNCVCAFTQSKSAFCTRRFSTKRVNEAFVLKGPDNANIEQVPMPPQPGPNQVLLRTLNVGICGSDTHYWHDGACGVYVVKKPMILGHETSAVVESVGSKVKHLKPGDRVVTEPAVPCESCDFCRSGMYNLCPDVACHATPPYDGTLTNYFVHHSGYTFKIPDSITNEEAALIEPLSVGVYSCKRANVTVGSRVLITGAGPIGIVTAMAAKAFGATKVVLTDVNQKRLNFAKELGADQVILMTDNITEKEMIEKIKNEFNGEQPNISIECSGAAACSRLVLLATNSGGVAVLVGLGPAEVLLPIADAASREVTILGAFRYKHCFPIAIDLAASGRLQLNKLASHRFDFKDCSKAFEMARSGAGMKVVIKVSD